MTLRSAGGDLRQTRRCSQCGGFWFDAGTDQDLTPDSVNEFDAAQPNYSLKSFSLTCPQDETLLEPVEPEAGPTGLKMWSCPECKNVFYPRGQLALYTNWAFAQNKEAAFGLYSRAQAALAVMLIALGGIAGSVMMKNGFSAAGNDPLPTSGPNIATLVLLALTYIAGTVLAVLGRRAPITLMGWSVIAICLVGFFVIVFGP